MTGRESHQRDRTRRSDEVLVSRFPVKRRLVTAAVRAGRRIVPMHGLIEVDVTDARRLLARSDPPLSLTAFVIAPVARAVARHPEVHSYLDWRGRLVQHRRVDVQTLVEIATSDGPFGMVHVIRDANLRCVPDIDAELRTVKQQPEGTTNGWLLARLAPIGGRIPGLYPAMFMAMSRSRRVRAVTGTVQVTAVGMFGGGAGFAIAPATVASCTVVVGGLDRRPRVQGDQVVIREMLDLTVSIDHNVTDGGPATRFAADLRRTIESAAALSADPGGASTS